MSVVCWFILLLIVIGVILFFCNFRDIHVPNLFLVSGNLKSGKSALSLCLLISKYRKVHFKWRIKNFFRKLFHMSLISEPLIYSDIPIGIRNGKKFDFIARHNVVLDKSLVWDMFAKKIKPVEKSCLWLDEASLFASSIDIDISNNDRILNLFVKLWAHQTKGGYMGVNTQAVEDLHYAFKRCINSYYFIDRCIKFIPFILVFHVRDLMNNVGVNVNVSNKENSDFTENGSKWFVCSKKIWKYYDCYAFSHLYDNVDIYDRVYIGDDMKVKSVDFSLRNKK